MMRRSYSLFVLLLGLLSCQTGPRQTGLRQQSGYDAIQYVDPQIGSVHGRWFFYTPAALPFGMAKLAPHTNAYESMGSWLPGGYDDRHASIEGFGHFHEFQIGGVVVMPTVGELLTTPGTLENPDEGYRSRFDKEDEHSTPGYYSVLLKDYGIRAELTATDRVGFHRYTFPESEQARLIFDIGHKQGESSDVTEAMARMAGKNEVEGYVETNPEYVKFCDPGNRVKMYFVARLSKSPVSAGTFVDGEISENRKETRGTRNGIYVDFSTDAGEVVEMQVGLSYCSLENARMNLEAEAGDISFDEVREQAAERWNDMLGRIRVEDDNLTNKTKFYTGLYHALLGRGLASDVNGQYKLNGDGVGQIPLDEDGVPRYRHFNSDGFWGGFWNLGQLWALAYPEYLSQYVQSNIDFSAETGWLHDGVAAGAFTNGVQTNFQGLLIAAAYNCGIRDFDYEAGYRIALKNEVEHRGRNLGNGKYDLGYFTSMGYVPYKDTTISNGWVFNFGASHTLEYAFSSYAVAQMALDLGTEQEYKQLLRQAGYWENLFDPESKFIRPRLPDGAFIADFDPMKGWDGFQEGNAYQYSWYVPHDPAALIGKMGKELFNQRLEKTFTESRKSLFGGGKEIHSFSGVETLYNQGNQPCLHQPWLFNYSGKPWLTQFWTRTICDEFYGTQPLHGYGFGQDEDQGQLGAWYVMAALGLFDVQGHSSAHPAFQFGSPMFRKVSIRLSEDKELVLETTHNSAENKYVQGVSFNGKSIDNCWIERAKLMKGGTLEFEMGVEPNKSWGVGVPPPSMSTVSRESSLKERIQSNEYFAYTKERALEVVKTGFNAGDGYGEVWIRDYNTFIELSAEVYPEETLKENLRVFLRLQRDDGNIIDGFIPREKAVQTEGGYEYTFTDLEPDYAGQKNNVETDHETSLVQAVYKYVKKTGDSEFLQEKIGSKSVAQRLEWSMEYLMDHRWSEEYGLIWGATTADWGDVQHCHPWGVYLTDDSKYCVDIYDNAMLIIALDNLMEMLPETKEKWQSVRDGIAENTMQHLWDPANQKFIPHLYLDGSPFPEEFDENQIFYHGGTAVAIEAGLLTKEQIRVSLEKMMANVEASGAGSIGLTLYPPYPAGSFENKGMYPYGYQNGGDWTWFGGRMIQQLIKNGFMEEAYAQIRPMVKRVKDNEGFYEWYTVDNKPEGSGTFRGSAGVLYSAIVMFEEYAEKEN